MQKKMTKNAPNLSSNNECFKNFKNKLGQFYCNEFHENQTAFDRKRCVFQVLI